MGMKVLHRYKLHDVDRKEYVIYIREYDKKSRTVFFNVEGKVYFELDITHVPTDKIKEYSKYLADVIISFHTVCYKQGQIDVKKSFKRFLKTMGMTQLDE